MPPGHRQLITAMHAIPSPRRSSVFQLSGIRWAFVVAAMLAPALLPGGVRAQNWIGEDREAAMTWAMHDIAVIQAAGGDVQGAKRTVSQIDEDGPPGPAEVTVVSFCNGLPIYDHLPGSIGGSGCARRESWRIIACDRIADHVPLEVPPGLPSNYLAPDRRHGAVVDFVDDYDSHGTRLTSRRYADGYVVIETPHTRQK
jgi:hypothetical protein